MLEAEVAFADADTTMDVVEACLNSCSDALLEDAAEDTAFLRSRAEGPVFEGFDGSFARMTYTEAIEALSKSGEAFKFPVEWGTDLKFEHEQWLAREHCRGPVFVTDYPASIKPFYARQNADGTTAAAFDLLVPGMGELVGGSAREERLDVLDQNMQGLSPEARAELSWYRDLRRYGSAPHAGFGVGFERMLQYFTGIANIRDAVPFPRHAGACRL